MIDFLLPYLYQIFNKCLDIRFYLIYFRSLIKIVFRKPVKPDYIIAKVYYFITLFNILGKALEFIFTKKITYLAKIYKLLPYNHFGTKWARSTKHAFHYIVKHIYNLLNKKKIALVLLLDITDNFDNVFKNRRLYNFCAK